MIDLETRYKSVVHYNYFQKSLRKVSKLYGVSKSSLQRWVKESPRYCKPRKPKAITNDIKSCISEEIQNNPFIKINELSSIISVKCNLQRSRRTINRYVKTMKMSYKTAYRMVDAKHSNEDV